MQKMVCQAERDLTISVADLRLDFLNVVFQFRPKHQYHPIRLTKKNCKSGNNVVKMNDNYP